VQTVSQWDRNGQIVVQQQDPLPITVLAIVPQVTVSGAKNMVPASPAAMGLQAAERRSLAISQYYQAKTRRKLLTTTPSFRR
jgi:hypothetical protein